jgi:hypothetical protein
MDTNVLYYGDSLDILRRYLPDAAVDLYLDPPFNSNRDDTFIPRRAATSRSSAADLGYAPPISCSRAAPRIPG